MDFKIVEFNIDPCPLKIARMLIDYHGLMIRCDLVYYVKGHKPWIRMPERWFNATSKVSYCFWPTRKVSNQFQKEVLNKIFDRYDLNLEKIAELHSKHAKKHIAGKK